MILHLYSLRLPHQRSLQRFLPLSLPLLLLRLRPLLRLLHGS